MDNNPNTVAPDELMACPFDKDKLLKAVNRLPLDGIVLKYICWLEEQRHTDTDTIVIKRSELPVGYAYKEFPPVHEIKQVQKLLQQKDGQNE